MAKVDSCTFLVAILTIIAGDALHSCWKRKKKMLFCLICWRLQMAQNCQI